MAETLVFRVEHEITRTGPYDGGGFMATGTWAAAQGDGPMTDFAHVPWEICRTWHYGCPTLKHALYWFGETALDKLARARWHLWAYAVEEEYVKLAISGVQVIFKRDKGERVWRRAVAPEPETPPPPRPAPLVETFDSAGMYVDTLKNYL